MSRRQKIFLVLLNVIGLTIWSARRGSYPDLEATEALARYADATSAFVQVDGMNVHYRDTGSGPPIVLLHGNSSSLHTWDGWTRQMETHRRVVRLDLPGFGLTGLDPTGSYDFQHQCEFLAHFLDAVGVTGPSDLAGNSHGGQVAWTFATLYPERVRKLIMIDASGYPIGFKGLLFRLRGTWPVSWIAGWLTPRFLVDAALRDTFGDPTKVTDALVDHYHGLQLAPGNRLSIAAMRDIYAKDDSALITKVAKPTLVLWGAKDNLFPVENATRFAKAIAGSKVIVYETAGHIPMEELPQQTAQDAEAFLDQ